MRAVGAFCPSHILVSGLCYCRARESRYDSPLLGFWGALSLGRGGWLGLVIMGEAGYSAQWKPWSSIPGREEERKEAASFLGLGTCWTDGLESASGEAGG